MEEYAAVFATHHARLLRVAEMVSGDRDVAADAVAEAFARTYPHWRRKRIDDVGAYLRRAVINEITGTWRRRRPFPNTAGAPDATSDNGDHLVEHDRVWRAIATLTPRQRAAVVLRYYEDLSEADIARALGVAPGTVKSTLSRALDRLRVLLADNGGAHEKNTGADHA